jgi:hypothetical protein
MVLRSAILSSLLLVAACTEVPGPCATTVAGELRMVERLIAETRATIERGYVLAESGGAGINLCVGNENNGVGVSFCTDGTRKKPVAIDEAAERRKLDALLKRREALLRRKAEEELACERT